MSIIALRSDHYFSNRRARVVIHRQLRQFPIGQHRHDFSELALVIGGSGVHVTGRFRQEIVRGDVLVITGQRAHGYEKTQGLHLLNILIRNSMLPRIGRDLRGLPGYHALFGDPARRQEYVSHLRLSSAEFAQVEEWGDRLEAETQLTGPEGHLLAEAYLTLIVGVLCRRYDRKKAERVRPAAKFSTTLSFIEKHIDKPMKVAELAKRAGMSERSFFRGFQDTMGMSPAEYLLKARIQRATDRLAHGEPDRRISEIAQECGFDDSNYFSRAFRKVVGLSPREFRVQYAGRTKAVLANH